MGAEDVRPEGVWTGREDTIGRERRCATGDAHDEVRSTHDALEMAERTVRRRGRPFDGVFPNLAVAADQWIRPARGVIAGSEVPGYQRTDASGEQECHDRAQRDEAPEQRDHVIHCTGHD